MEFDEESLDASWANFSNGKPKLFIINEEIISKLCILGDDYEPCFEGSNITAPTQFSHISLSTEFKHRYYAMMQEIKELKRQLKTDKGGAQVFTKYAVTVGDNLYTQLYSNIDNTKYSLSNVLVEGEQLFAVLQDRSNSKFSRVNFSLNNENITAIVLDRGVTGTALDLLVESEAYALSNVGRKNISYQILRFGYNR